MPALYSHTTRATGTVLTATIYNGDHQNHIDNGVPAQLDDYSATVGQMQTATSPGGIGSESLPTSLAGELERIRYVLRQLINGDQWYAKGSAPGAHCPIDMQVFTSSGTWTKPAGCTAALVRVVGGGGGGGGAAATSASQYSAGGGGGAGGYSEEWITAGLGATETVTVGTGGTAGTGANVGSNGNNSSFGAHLTGNGGIGGAMPVTSSAFGISSPSAGGGASGGNINVSGGQGGYAILDGAAVLLSGRGGDSVYGGGALPVSSNTAGNAGGTNQGGGGSGAANNVSQGTRTGGNGGSGIVIVQSFT